MSQKQIGSDGRYRRTLRNFGGSGQIQGTEDWPIDPSVDDAKVIGVAALFGFAALAAMPTGFEVVGWVIASGIVALACVVIYVCPNDRAPLAWLGAIGRFKRAPKRLTNHAEDPKRRTQNLTEIEDVVQIADAIRRRDGTLVGAVKVTGRDMALAETDEWNRAAAGFEDLADAVDGGIEVFSPGRVVRASNLVSGYYGRETDEDVKRNDTLAELVETYTTELPREFKRRGVATRDFYVLVWVTESEVRRADHGVLAKLSDLPGVGGALARIGLARRGPDDVEIKSRQRSMLAGRKRAVENAVGSIDGCDAEPVDSEHLVALLEEYWTARWTRREGKPLPRHRLPVVARTEETTEEAHAQ